MFYVMRQRTKKANGHPDSGVFDLLAEFATYDEALDYLKRNKQGVQIAFIFESHAIADFESIFDYVGGSVYVYE